MSICPEWARTLETARDGHENHRQRRDQKKAEDRAPVRDHVTFAFVGAGFDLKGPGGKWLFAHWARPNAHRARITRKARAGGRSSGKRKVIPKVPRGVFDDIEKWRQAGTFEGLKFSQQRSSTRRKGA